MITGLSQGRKPHVKSVFHYHAQVFRRRMQASGSCKGALNARMAAGRPSPSSTGRLKGRNEESPGDV